MISKRESNAIKAKMDLLNAVGVALKKHGFAKLGINTVAAEAKMDKTAIYRYYNGFEDLLKAYVDHQEHWLESLKMIGERKIPDMNKLIKDFLREQIEILMDSEEFQQLLVWELADKDNIAAPITVKREIYSEGILKQSRVSLEKSGINLNFIMAVLIGGIYYLVIHKNQYKFCEVDLNQKKHKEELIRTLDWLIDLLFETNRQVSEVEEIAKRLYNKGMSKDEIMEITNISSQKLDVILI